MVVHCIIDRDDDVKPVVLFLDIKEALAYFKSLEEDGKTNIKFYATDL